MSTRFNSWSYLGKITEASAERRRRALYGSPEEVDSCTRNQINHDHFCINCRWGRIIDDVVMCPFIAGSCARFPSTMENPNPGRLEALIETSKKLLITSSMRMACRVAELQVKEDV